MKMVIDIYIKLLEMFIYEYETMFSNPEGPLCQSLNMLASQTGELYAEQQFTDLQKIYGNSSLHTLRESRLFCNDAQRKTYKSIALQDNIGLKIEKHTFNLLEEFKDLLFNPKENHAEVMPKLRETITNLLNLRQQYD